MKRNIIAIMMVMVALLATQCKKSAEPLANEPAGETMEVTVRVENNTAKTDITATGVVTWKQGDKLYVVGATQGLLGYVSAVANGDPTQFEGEITALTSPQVLRFYYVGDKGFTLDGSDNYTFDLSSQDGTLEGIAAHSQLMFGKTTSTIAVGTTNFGTITMTSLMSIAHLNINEGGTAVSGPVAVTGGFATSTFNAKTYNGTTPLTGTAGNITMTFAEGTASTNCYLALLPGTQTLNFSADGKEVTLAAKAIAANKFYNVDNAVEVAVKPSYLPGEFTVDGSGTKVKFSRGNLQYLGKSDGTGTWRFAEHQWDIMGAGPSATSNKGNVDLGADYAGKYNTCFIDDRDKAAARDLFGWGCTGFQDTRTSSTGYQNNYLPYSTSTSGVSGGSGINDYGYGPDYDATNEYGLSVEHMSDWGCVTGLPSAGEGKSWRTLSGAEWAYLFNTRTVNGHTGVGYSYRRATINSDASDGSRVYGMLLYPDGYTAQTTATSYTTEQWSAMESAGVVFLPAAGDRKGTTLYDVGTDGLYWSSSCYSSNYAYHVYFDSGYFIPQYKVDRYYGFSVRLVSEN